ncbi:MAG: radical SAM protein [Myxococcota bacterium]|nr:radical SAM protein [Myxococcota bacterium]
MRYLGKVFRPPSESDAYILQASIGCSWNKCTYCTMYDDKPEFQIRPLKDTLDDIRVAGQTYGSRVEKVFVADGDALVMPTAHWVPILAACRVAFPRLRRVSCYAMASNVQQKSVAELKMLVDEGLTQLYIGPESGDDATLKRIAKGATAADHIEAAEKARQAGFKQSVIFLLGAGGVSRSIAHAAASAELATAMDPDFLAALTLTVQPGTPIHRLQETNRFELPTKSGLLKELRCFVQSAAPSKALFRTNHASNYLPIGGYLPDDRSHMLDLIDEALASRLPLRQEWMRGL